MANTNDCIEEHKTTLLQIWEKAAGGDVTSDFKEFNNNLSKDGLSMADLFNTASVDNDAGEDLQKQIEIRGHINQFIGLESGRIKRQDQLAALEEADGHIAKAFAMAKETTIAPAMQRTFFALETAIVANVNPLVTPFTKKPTLH